MAKLADKLNREKRELATDEEKYGARKQEELIGIGESVFNFFWGRRNSRIVSGAMRKRRLTSEARLDIEESHQEIAALREEKDELEAELQEMTREITRKWSDLLDNLDTDDITPRRTDVNIRLLALAWQPYWLITYDDDGGRRTVTLPAYARSEE